MNSNMVLGGFLIMLICQDIVAFRAFKTNYKAGMLCAMIPGYILYYAGRSGEKQQLKPVAGWLVGLVILLMGFVR